SASALRSSSASRSWPDPGPAFGCIETLDPLDPLDPLARPAADLTLFLVFTARAMRELGIPNPPTRHIGSGLYRRCFAAGGICIVCIVRPVFPCPCTDLTGIARKDARERAYVAIPTIPISVIATFGRYGRRLR